MPGCYRNSCVGSYLGIGQFLHLLVAASEGAHGSFAA